MKSTAFKSTPTTDGVQPVGLAGGAAFSAFRIQSLVARLQAAAPDLRIAEIQASFVYALDVDGELPPASLEKIRALLGAGRPFDAAAGFVVTPRHGTISPWSSKATDVFHNSGLTRVRRVERGIQFCVRDDQGQRLTVEQLRPVLDRLHDRMTQGVYADLSDLFRHIPPGPYRSVDVLAGGRDALREANRSMGLALSDEEVDYLVQAYRQIARNPTDVELVMFGQVNSEHCRHKIFNASWRIDGEDQPHTLFEMIRHTHACHPEGTLVAYADNSGVIEGFPDEVFEPDGDGRYGFLPEQVDLIMKVETHNHPTAIAPFPGAATGVGGEIRDEGATGIGARSKAGLSAFMVSNLRIPGFAMPWEREAPPFPRRLATPLDIMLEGPIGGAGFGNEFGRPQLLGLFRTYEDAPAGAWRGYHKPIMTAGGMGIIKRRHVEKHDIPPGALIIQLGGPAMRIGLGGGAASSMATGSNEEALDFDSVQRDNAEMQRRCQEAINACIALGDENPILTIHDIGAGGLSNGCPELVAKTGGEFWLREVPNEDSSMSPMEIWCCEAQERYVLAIAPESLERFRALCARERCPMAVLGRATGDGHLTLIDNHFDNKPIDIDIGVILGKPPRMLRDVTRQNPTPAPLDLAGITLDDAVARVLRFPAVADKTFLITITDRTVTGCVARDQMVGPYQVPIADAAVTVNGYRSVYGQAMTMGERTPVALVSGPASGRLAVGEALTNMAGVDVGEIGHVKLSGNWMCACGEAGEDAALYDTVQAVGMELCPALGVSIPVGKDSLSMRTLWQDPAGVKQRMVSPLSLVISAFAPVEDIHRTVTAELKAGPSALLWIDLGQGRRRLGASVLAQVYNQLGNEVPDLDDPGVFLRFFGAMQRLVREGRLLAYHDISDGGLFVTLVEMAFGGRRGLRVSLPAGGDTLLPALFAEELGAVIQVAEDQIPAVQALLRETGLDGITCEIARPAEDRELRIEAAGTCVFCQPLAGLRRTWSETTHRLQALRDNPACAQEEYDNLLDDADPGLSMVVTFETAAGLPLGSAQPRPPAGNAKVLRPRVAILREQGVNGHVEMAAAFDAAGFESVDVHMTDLLGNRVRLDGFSGLVACGGFSYGDVLGAGAGWASCILFNDELRAAVAAFFARPDTFALGICNGCQMMAQLKDIIPGAEHWPRFVRNTSEQFEARLVTVEVLDSPSVLLRDMAGSRLLVPVAHGEGRADFSATGSQPAIWEQNLASLRYVDNHGRPTVRYPYNPNGSAGGLTGVTTRDGRVTLMMPHPERAFRSCQLSYRPPAVFNGEAGPWLRMFQNARAFVG